MEPKLILQNTREMHLVSVRELLFIEADGNYSNVWLTNNDPFLHVIKEKGSEEKVINRDEVTEKNHSIKKIQLVMQLGDIEKRIEKSSNNVREKLVRIGRSYIVNVDYLFRIDLSESLLYLMDTDHNIFKLKIEHQYLVKLKEKLGK
ncbi:MAG: hypothetical protein MJZ93_06435 [Paludibacteraceae bacterium]|nr:hypothetical protein [Paludibacteraceae bacterium]